MAEAVQPSAGLPPTPAVAGPTPPTPSAVASAPSPVQSPFTWPRLWEHTLAFVLGACAILVAQSAWKHWRQPEPLASGAALVDMNTADVGTLRQLPGVGPHLAARIVEHRTRQGYFGSLDDLLAVPGIGPATLERLRPVVALMPQSHESHPSRSPAPLASSKRKLSSDEPIDVNTASREQLMELPGIGPVMAERIIQERDINGPFKSVQELSRVKGIKGKTLEKLTPYLKVTQETVKSTT